MMSIRSTCGTTTRAAVAAAARAEKAGIELLGFVPAAANLVRERCHSVQQGRGSGILDIGGFYLLAAHEYFLA